MKVPTPSEVYRWPAFVLMATPPFSTGLWFRSCLLGYDGCTAWPCQASDTRYADDTATYDITGYEERLCDRARSRPCTGREALYKGLRERRLSTRGRHGADLFVVEEHDHVDVAVLSRKRLGRRHALYKGLHSAEPDKIGVERVEMAAELTRTWRTGYPTED